MAAFSTNAVRLLLAVLVAAGVSGAIYLGVRGGGNDGQPQVAGQLTQTLTVVATTTAPSPTAVEATLTPAATLEATTVPPPPTGTPDTRVPSRDLPTLDQIRLDSDGKYFVDDRGDGCPLFEVHRANVTYGGQTVLEVVLQSDCHADFIFAYQPELGEIRIQAQ
jgi:hypothetical protein